MTSLSRTVTLITQLPVTILFHCNVVFLSTSPVVGKTGALLQNITHLFCLHAYVSIN